MKKIEISNSSPQTLNYMEKVIYPRRWEFEGLGLKRRDPKKYLDIALIKLGKQI